MTTTVKKEFEHLGDSKAVANHDHDLIHELSKRVDAIWRMDQYAANAGAKPQLREFWETLKQQEQSNVDRLKQLVAQEIRDGCF